MAKQFPVRTAIEIAAPQAVVWARVSEHETTPTWVDAVKKVTITREGRLARNGLGAQRRVEFKPKGWNPVDEEVVLFEPPHQFHYVVLRGTPGLLAHLGKVIVDDLGPQRSRLRWEVDFTFRTLHPLRPLVPTMMKNFEAVLNQGLANLKAQIERRAAAA